MADDVIPAHYHLERGPDPIQDHSLWEYHSDAVDAQKEFAEEGAEPGTIHRCRDSSCPAWQHHHESYATGAYVAPQSTAVLEPVVDDREIEREREEIAAHQQAQLAERWEHSASPSYADGTYVGEPTHVHLADGTPAVIGDATDGQGEVVLNMDQLNEVARTGEIELPVAGHAPAEAEINALSRRVEILECGAGPMVGGNPSLADFLGPVADPNGATVVDEAMLRESPCVTYNLGDGTGPTFARGAVGALSPDQIETYCGPRQIRELSPRQMKRLGAMMQSSAVCSDEVDDTPKGDRFKPYTTCMDRELRSRGEKL